MRIVVVIIVLLSIGFYFNVTDRSGEESILMENGDNSPKVDNELSQEAQSNTLPVPKEGLGKLMGANVEELKKIYGEPARIDPSSYEYEWWIYNKDESTYFQVGVLDEKVITIYVLGEKADVSPYQIGQKVGDIYVNTPIETNISFDYNHSSYRFELSEDEINNRPLIQIGDFFAQLYIDKFTGTLSSIRYMDAKTLLHLRPYELVYRGELLDVETMPDDTEAIEKGTEKQIFDMTNVLRKRFGLNTVEWDEPTSIVAMGHSVDMYTSETFSHTSDKYGDLEDRLAAGSVFYQIAGENIAAGYTDAPAVIEGWLNSKGHRECLLNENFTHLGIGVYQKYYTQNFIEKW